MKNVLICVCLCLLLVSCDRPACTNTNPVFDRYDPVSNEYKAELVKQLQSGAHAPVRYWIDKYKEINGKPFMIVYVQGEGLCARAYIDIKNPNKLQQFKNVKGISYQGAEIRGMQYAIDTIDGKIVFLYEEGRIID